MSGFRKNLFDAGLEILERHIDNGEALTTIEGQTLRELWECSHVGNLLIQALDEVAPWAFDNGDIARLVRNAPGFLTGREVWYAKRLSHRTITAYRGANREEFEPGNEIGISWTTDFRVAQFFAERAQDGVVLQAQVRAAMWLETAESELIVPEIGGAEIEIVPTPSGFEPIRSADWDSVKPIPPKVTRSTGMGIGKH